MVNNSRKVRGSKYCDDTGGAMVINIFKLLLA